MSEEATYDKRATDNGGVQKQILAENTYSTEERQIGYWIDGKPLYRKCYTFSKQASIVNQTDNIIIATINNIKSIVNFSGYFKSGNAYNALAFPYNSSWFARPLYFTDNHQLAVQYLAQDPNPIEGCLIVEYTKTTD